MLNDFSKVSPFSSGKDNVSLVNALTITKLSSSYALCCCHSHVQPIASYVSPQIPF